MNNLMPITNEIKELEITLNYGEIYFETGDAFSVSIEHENAEDIVIKENGNCLSITDERKKTVLQFGKTKCHGPIIKITLPSQQHFQKVTIQSGASEIDADKLETNQFILKMGAGEFEVKELNVLDHTTIESGAGEVNIKSGNIHNLELSSGAGEINCHAALTGRSCITTGVGEINLQLPGNPDDYSVTVAKGIGRLSVKGATSWNGRTYGDGPNHIEVTGGVGEINVDFQ